MKTRSGYIALIGRPNVGKSTLLNTILSEKVSITSRKPQTTRHRILGIKTDDQVQSIYVDTPGIHRAMKHTINRFMIKTAIDAISDVDVIIFVVDARYWREEDDFVLQEIIKTKRPFVVALNKSDRIENPDDLLPILQTIEQKLRAVDCKDVPLVPVSAKTGRNVPHLEQLVAQELPENPHFFPPDQLTDRSDRFMAAELIREKLIRQVGHEIPHEIAVEIEQFGMKNNILHIHAIIWVERSGQKKIIIGEKGAMLKNVGRLARLDMEKIFEHKVFLQLWVKVKRGWMDDERALMSLGYG